MKTPKKNITMQDVAKKLKISSVTVSKALNNKEGVSDELKQKIIALAKDMGYRYNALAKSMRDGCSYNIGILIAERFIGENQSFYLDFYKNISAHLESHQFYAILHILTSSDENNLIQPKICLEKKIDGLIVLGQVSKTYIDMLKGVDLPFVFLDFYDDHDEIDCIITDNFYGTYDITNYLLSMGHRKIAYIGSLNSTSSIQDRFLGYYKSLIEHKIRLREEYVIPDRDDLGKAIPLVLPKDMPTAFVCNCDKVAFVLIDDLKQLGIKVPEDVSVVGFDNNVYSSMAEPQITTVEVNMDEMSESAVKLMIDKIKLSRKSYGRILVKTRIIYRDSVSRPAI